MKVEYKKALVYFLLFTVLSVVIFQYDINRNYLIYNLALSFIPYVLSLFLLKNRISKTFTFLIFIVALTFYPNAIYMFTDFIHITTSHYYTFDGYGNILYSTDYINWITLGTDIVAIFLSISLSFESFEHFSSILRLNKLLWKLLFLIPLSLITGVAIYMGRILRLNSWHLVTSVPEIISVSKTLVLPEVFSLVLIFSAIHFLLIVIFLTTSRRK